MQFTCSASLILSWHIIGGGAYWAGRSKARATFPQWAAYRAGWPNILEENHFQIKLFFPLEYTVKIIAIRVIGNSLA
jgi:hypothetical protein